MSGEIPCFSSNDDDVHAPLLVTTSLLSVRHSVCVPPVEPRPSSPTVPGTLVAFDGHRGCIYGVWVHHSFQRQGCGGAIVAEAEDWLRQRGAQVIHLHVRFTNLGVMRFYEKLGYRFQDMVVLGKTLEMGV